MAFTDLLNIRQNERLPVLLFIIQSTFLGAFFGTITVGAETLFLNQFDPSMISKAYLVSGAAGIILTSIYSRFQSRIHFSKLAFANLSVVLLITLFLRVGYFYTESKWLTFFLLVMMGPLTIVSIVGFWGSVSRIFDLRQGKRLFGMIDGGTVLGIILSSVAIPVIIERGFQTINLLFLSAASAFGALAFQVIINFMYPKQLKRKPEQANRKEGGFVETIKIPYVRTMSAFVILSMLVAFFVQYLFLAVADERFVNSEELAKFFGMLMGTLTFVSILIKTFVYGPIMKNYGLKISLLLSPVIMGLVTISAAVVGSLFGYTSEAASFTFFFLLISLGKLFQKALKDSFEAPALKMLYQSLNPAIRYEVQARVDGTINEIAALLSGFVLTVFSLLTFFKLIHYTFVLGGLVFLWGIVTFRLYSGYRRTLQETLDNSSKLFDKKENREHFIASDMEVSNYYQLLQTSRPWDLVPELKRKILDCPEDEMIIVIEKIDYLGDVSFSKELEKCQKGQKNDLLFKRTERLLVKLNEIRMRCNDYTYVNSLVESPVVEDRVMAGSLIFNSKEKEIKKLLGFLFRDLVPQVKIKAIWAARGIKQKEIINFLIDFIFHQKYAPYAHMALIGSGETGMEMLEQAYLRSQITDKDKERILRIIPLTNSELAYDSLINKFSQNLRLNKLILQGLLHIDREPSEKQKMVLHQKVIDQAGVCAWNLNALFACPSEKQFPFLKTALEREYHKSIDELFLYLKVIYDAHSIEAVKENIEAGTGESISFAIELLDTFVDEDLKPYFFPLLEDLSEINKLHAVENYFPLRSFDQLSLLNAIINRDVRLISRQTKFYALNAYSHLEKIEVQTDLVAQLFNNDRIMKQLASQILFDLDAHNYLAYKKRMKDKNRVELDRDLELFQKTGRTIIDRFNFLKNAMNANSLDEENALFLVYKTNIMGLASINLFDMDVLKDREMVVFVEQGSLFYYHGTKLLENFMENSILNLKSLRDKGKEYKLISSENCIVHTLDVSKIAYEVYDELYIQNFIGSYCTLN